MKLSNIIPQIKTEKVEVKRPEATAASKPGGGMQGDRVNLSAGTQDVQKIKEVLAQTPEVRVERIKALKDQIERGEYQVDAHAVADRMLATLLGDHRLQ